MGRSKGSTADEPRPTAVADPYNLLRRAKALIEQNAQSAEHAAWLKDFTKLPGAALTEKQLQVLRNQYRRYNANTKTTDIIELLLAKNYLIKIHHVGRRGPYHAIRLTPEGREALRLREDVKP